MVFVVKFRHSGKWIENLLKGVENWSEGCACIHAKKDAGNLRCLRPKACVSLSLILEEIRDVDLGLPVGRAVHGLSLIHI